MGTADRDAKIQAPNERVLLSEFERAILAEMEFFARSGAAYPETH